MKRVALVIYYGMNLCMFAGFIALLPLSRIYLWAKKRAGIVEFRT